MRKGTILALGAMVLTGGSLPPASAAVPVRVTGHEFAWIIRYPGPDSLLDTADDVLDRRDLRLPPASQVTIDLRSDDYVYTFHVPEIDLVEMAVPDRPFLLRLTTSDAGTYRLMGGQMCGYTHPGLLGRVMIEPGGDSAGLFGAPR